MAEPVYQEKRSYTARRRADLKTSENIPTTTIKQKPSRVCLLGATFETSNMGVSTLTEGAIRCALHAWPRARIFLLDYSTERKEYKLPLGSRHALVELINIRFSKKFYLSNNIAYLLLLALITRVSPSRSLSNRITETNPWLRQLSQMDIIASIAGGDNFSDIYGIGRFFYVSLPQLLVVLMGKEVSGAI